MMLLGVVIALAAAPIYWLVLPVWARQGALLVGSLAAIAAFDVRLPAVLVILVALLHVASKGIAAYRSRGTARLVAAASVVPLMVLFAWNKLAPGGDGHGPLQSQGGLVLVGISYLVLKATAILIETSRHTLAPPGFFPLLRWLAFFPTYPSGPIEAFPHFEAQTPVADRERILQGCERILFGCVRVLVVAHILSEWTAPVLRNPEVYPIWALILTLYAATFRIYSDFGGYSDVAIGVAAVYGYSIQENFDYPLGQRSIVGLWQRWHMTLTGWLRIYVFTPYSRAVMRRGRRWHRFAVASGQIVTMVFCGLWHDLSPGFVLWGALHGVALAWVGVVAPRAGTYLPTAVVTWWRTSRLAHALAIALTVTTFSLVNVFALVDLATAGRYVRSLVGLG